VNALRAYVLKRWESSDSHSKVLGFAVRFLKFLASTRRDQRYLSFELYLERPRMKKIKKAITERIVTRNDIVAALQRINTVEAQGAIADSKARNFSAYVLLAAYTGLRQSTIQRLKVGQLRAAVNEEKPTLLVYAEQEKNRVEHYVPLHPIVVSVISEVFERDFGEKDDDKPFFMFNSFEKCLAHGLQSLTTAGKNRNR
jgi:integrase